MENTLIGSQGWGAARRSSQAPALPWRLVLVAAIVLVQFFDLITTVTCVSLGLSEANPLVAHVLASYGSMGFAVLKIGLATAIGAAVLKLDRGTAIVGGLTSIALTAMAVISNLQMMDQL